MNNEIQTENEAMPLLSTKAKNKSKLSMAFKKLSDRFSSSEYSYLLFAFLVPAIIMYIVYVAMEIHPFGENSVLVLDLNGQYVYFFEELKNILGEGNVVLK